MNPDPRVFWSQLQGELPVGVEFVFVASQNMEFRVVGKIHVMNELKSGTLGSPQPSIETTGMNRSESDIECWIGTK